MELIPNDNSKNRQTIKHNSLINTYICQNDFLYFKNELLKDLKTLESKLTKRIQSSKEEYENKITNIENKLYAIKEKLFENNKKSFVNEINKDFNEKINNLIVFKEKIEEKIYNQEQQIKEINKQSVDSIYSLNKYIKDNLAYPEIIGYNGKFTSFRDFIDHMLSSLDNLNSFKRKMLEIDLQSYKAKIDKLILSNKNEFEQFKSSSKKLAVDNIVVYDNKMNELIKIFENKLINEKKEYENQINKLYQKIVENNNIIEINKIELMTKISENNYKINENRIQFEKYFNELDNINHKIENFKEVNKKVKKEYDEKMNSLEYKLITKMSHLYTLIKNNNIELNKKYKLFFNNEDSKSYNNNNVDKLFERNMSESKNKNNESDSPLIKNKSSLSISNLQKYINGEIGDNELSYIKKKKDSNNDKILLDKRKNNSIPNTVPNNIKYTKLNKDNSLFRNNKEKNDSRIFMDKNQLNSYIMKSDNTLLSIIPRKDIIKHIFLGSNDLIPSFYFKNNNNWNISLSTKKFDEKIIKKAKFKRQLFKNNNNKFFKRKLINKSQSYYNKKYINKNINSSDDNKYLSKDEIDDHKRSYSTLNKKNKKIQHISLFSYYDSDNIKKHKNPEVNNENKNNSSSNLSRIFKNINSDIKAFDLNVEENRLKDINLKKNNKYKGMKNEKIFSINENKVYRNLNSNINHYLNLMINKDNKDKKDL